MIIYCYLLILIIYWLSTANFYQSSKIFWTTVINCGWWLHIIISHQMMTSIYPVPTSQRFHHIGQHSKIVNKTPKSKTCNKLKWYFRLFLNITYILLSYVLWLYGIFLCFHFCERILFFISLSAFFPRL